MEGKSLKSELWREYEFGDTVYHIEKPVLLYVGKTTHRVVTRDGVVHCVPAPGFQGCVLRWKNRAGRPPVTF